MKKISENTSSVLGFFGSAFTALCCIGFSVLIGALGAVGAGFLVNDKYLIPVLILSLSLSLFGLVGAYKRRHNYWSMGIGTLGAIATLVSVFMSWNFGVYTGLVALMLATFWNLWEGLYQHRHDTI